MNNKRIFSKTIIISIFSLFLFPSKVSAFSITDTFWPNSPIQTFGSLVSVLLRLAYTLAGIIILFLLIFGGLSVIIGAGRGDSQKAGQGKQAVTAAVIGFIIIFASYWIIQLIALITGTNLLTP